VLIIRLIIRTIRLDPSGPDATDSPSHLSRRDPTGADQIDAEHQAPNLVVLAPSLLCSVNDAVNVLPSSTCAYLNGGPVLTCAAFTGRG
jgi:hypothetical protein